MLLAQLDEEAQNDFRQNKNLGVYEGGLFESIVAEALVKSGYALRYYKKENSTLQEEFFVRSKDCLVPIKVKSGNGNSKSSSPLIKNDKYDETRFGIKLIHGNIRFSSGIFTFPHFCAFLIKGFLDNLNIDCLTLT